MEKIIPSGQGKKSIFLSGSIRGGRQLLETYRFIYDALEEAGAEVLSWHVADPELENRIKNDRAGDLCQRPRFA